MTSREERARARAMWAGRVVRPGDAEVPTVVRGAEGIAACFALSWWSDGGDGRVDKTVGRLIRGRER